MRKKHTAFHNEPESAGVKIIFEETLQQENHEGILPTRENEPEINIKSDRKFNLLDKSQTHTSNNLKEDALMDNSVISLTKQFSSRLGSPVKGKKSSILLAKKFGQEDLSPEHRSLQIVIPAPLKKPKKKWMALSFIFLCIGLVCLTIGAIYLILSDHSHMKRGIVFCAFGIVCLLPSAYYSIKVCRIFRTNKKNKRKKPLQDLPV